MVGLSQWTYTIAADFIFNFHLDLGKFEASSSFLPVSIASESSSLKDLEVQLTMKGKLSWQLEHKDAGHFASTGRTPTYFLLSKT